jgi:hypothetical protein
MIGDGIIVESIASFKITWKNPGNGMQAVWDQENQVIEIHGSDVYPDLEFVSLTGLSTYFTHSTADKIIAKLKELNTVIDEFNNRFEILATEINEMKDILLKLQSYTMDVNKMLLNERIQIFSDIGVDDKNILVNTTEETSSVFNQEQNTSVDLRDLAIRELNEQEQGVGTNA